MEDRYRSCDICRDLKGITEIETMPVPEGEEAPKKMPQIVIIVDELADLMMVCPGEVEGIYLSSGDSWPEPQVSI